MVASCMTLHRGPDLLKDPQVGNFVRGNFVRGNCGRGVPQRPEGVAIAKLGTCQS